MKFNTGVFLTLAVTTTSVRGAPVQEHSRAVSVPSDPFVGCIRKTFPGFPKEGNPTQDQLRVCFPGAPPQEAHGTVARNVKETLEIAVQPRDFINNVQVLGKLMGLNQKSTCTENSPENKPITLHDEFVWPEDVTGAAVGLCNDAMSIIDNTGLREDGEITYVSKEFGNSHDEQSNYLHNGRKLLLTMAINFYPPAAVAKESIKDVANAVHDLCSSGVTRLMDPRDGCTAEVSWYVSQKAHFEKHLAAVGGRLDMWFDGSTNNVAQIQLGFTQDTN